MVLSCPTVKLIVVLLCLSVVGWWCLSIWSVNCALDNAHSPVLSELNWNVVSNNGESESQSAANAVFVHISVIDTLTVSSSVQSVMYTMNTWCALVMVFGANAVVIVGTVRIKLLKYISLSCIFRIWVSNDQQVIYCVHCIGMPIRILLN